MFSLKTSMLKNIDVFQTSPNTKSTYLVYTLICYFNYLPSLTPSQKYPSPLSSVSTFCTRTATSS